MGDYLYTDQKDNSDRVDHPDSAIRLASVVHRFKVPRMTRKVDFAKSFKTVGSNDKTRKVMIAADEARDKMAEGLATPKLSAERISIDTLRYQPLIHSILLSCKVQPEQARLDDRLIFEWKSGIESPKSISSTSYKSEAMMYDLVMTIACQGLAHAQQATEFSIGGDFAAASREYAVAAGIIGTLAEEQLPKWIAKGSNVQESALPLECNPIVAEGLTSLFMANGQQMAVATLLMKEGEPNSSLVAKLCLGVAEQLEAFLASVRRGAPEALARFDPEFLTLVTFQTAVHKSLSMYFQARKLWKEDQKFGVAIAMLKDSVAALKEQRKGSKDGGMPSVAKGSLQALATDLNDLRTHMQTMLTSWEKDNSSVYFTQVPKSVPAGIQIAEGIQMKKKTEFRLEEAEPVLLAMPAKRGQHKRSDSDLARELQQRLNSGLE